METPSLEPPPDTVVSMTTQISDPDPPPESVSAPDTPVAQQPVETDDADAKTHQIQLLAKLEEANRLLEQDDRACKTLTTKSPTPGHSRKGSQSSVVSTTSSNSHTSNQQQDEDATTSTTGNLWDIWGRLVNDWEASKKKPGFHKVLKELVRKGIPHHFRGLAWQHILGVSDSPHKEMYVDYLKKKSPCEKLIRRDIARTFPDHEFFKEKNGLGQESLFNVMKAYSLHDREVGYCQGSGFIVGLLLMQMPEEEAFAVLVKLMQDYRLRELFKPSMAELGLCMYKLECLVQELLPELYLHFQSQSFYTSMYASSWFLTLFATNLPLSLACRVMDLYISEGMDVIFRIGIAILQTSLEELTAMDMEGMLKFFQKDIPVRYEADPEKLFSTAYFVRYNAKKMKRLEKEYTALKSKENEEQIELRRLRTENRLLRQRIDNLEKESASLADRLIQYQVTRAQEAEDSYALKNELSTIKQKLLDTTKQLDEAQNLIGDIKQRTDSITSASSLDETEAQAVIQGLQEELIAVRLKEAESNQSTKELHCKVSELEDTIVRLQRAPSNDVQHLQEELIAVKLREAEANLSLKEMRQRVSELESYWEKYMERTSKDVSPKDKNANKQELRQLQEDMMTVKLREAHSLADLKDMKQKVMELETSNQILTNQIRRMDEDNRAMKTEQEEAANKERELKHQIKELQRKLEDTEHKKKEELMMARIHEAENAQLIAELRQKISEVEMQKEVLLTADQLDAKAGAQDLENRIFDLQDEVLQLKLSVSPQSGSRLSGNSGNESDDEDEDDDDEDDDVGPESLTRTLSEIIEGKSGRNLLSFSLNGDIGEKCEDAVANKNSDDKSENCEDTMINGSSREHGVIGSSEPGGEATVVANASWTGNIDANNLTNVNGDLSESCSTDTPNGPVNENNTQETVKSENTTGRDVYDVLVYKESKV